MIDDPELLRFLQQEETRAVDTTLSDERATALSFYRGEPFGDEIDGRSKLVTRDVAEVVDYMTVSVMRTMVSGDKIVEFEPVEPVLVEGPANPETGELGQSKDIASELAQEASERVHWNFLREQDGYMILQDGIKAGLLEKSGIWKSWVERKYAFEPARVNALELEVLGEDAIEPEELKDEEGEPFYDLHPVTEEPLQVYDVQVRTPLAPVFRDAAIANEQFFCSPDTRTLDTSPYCGDWSRQSLADLIELGYKPEEVSELWGDQPGEAQVLNDARDGDRANKENDVVRDNLNRIVVLREEYCRWWVGARWTLVRVHRVGNKILSVEPTDMQPYTLWCPFPMQHRLIGDSLADKVLDIQVVRSHMLRQAMDNLYLSNAPRVSINESSVGDTTIDDLLDVAPGGIIRHRGDKPDVWTVPFVAGNAFTAMEIMAGEKESRTGITRMNQGLDADALSKTATGTALMQASGQQIEEYVARNAANAVAELFEKKLKLMSAEMQPHSFRIDGEVKQIDPQQWPADMKLGVRVGLGTGNRDRRLQSITMIGQAMDDLRNIDPRLVTPENAFNAFKQLASILQVGQATQFCVDPATLGQAPPQPDPEVAKAEAKAASDAQKALADNILKREKARMDAETRSEKNFLDAQLDWEKMDRETQLAIMKLMTNSNETFSSGGSLAQ